MGKEEQAIIINVRILQVEFERNKKKMFFFLRYDSERSDLVKKVYKSI